MPYIENKRHRAMLDKMIDDYKILLTDPGYLNYVLHKLAKISCKKYQHYRNFLGELEAAKLEIYRRQTAPYEDYKKDENGDVE